jgi:hypothetical protein
MLSGKTLVEALAETPAAALIARCECADLAARLILAALGESSTRPGQSPIIRCQIREHLLLIFATSVAQAAKLRQAVPRLLAVLQARGLNLSEIRIRVQPSLSAEPTGGTPDRPSGSANALQLRPSTTAALQMAESLSANLRPSPLREAAERLARRLRGTK